MGAPNESRSTNDFCETQPCRPNDFGKPSTKGWNSASKSSPLNCKVVDFPRRRLLRQRRAHTHPGRAKVLARELAPARAHAPRKYRCAEQRSVWSSAVPPQHAEARQQRQSPPKGRIPLSVPDRSDRPLIVVSCDDVTWIQFPRRPAMWTPPLIPRH